MGHPLGTKTVARPIAEAPVSCMVTQLEPPTIPLHELSTLTARVVLAFSRARLTPLNPIREIAIFWTAPAGTGRSLEFD